MSDNGNSAEYKTLIRHQRDIVLALKHNLVSVSEVLIAVGLITPDQGSVARNRILSEGERANQIISIIQDAVLMDRQKFDLFLDTLVRDNEAQYGPTVAKLRSTYNNTPQNQSTN